MPLVPAFMVLVLSRHWIGVASKYIEGHLVTAEKWAFLARFCFLSDNGQFEYQIEYHKEYAVQNLLLYYDTADQWPAVYKSDKTCEQREAVLNLGQNQVVNLTESFFGSGCSNYYPRNDSISCHNARRFRSARPRWWFIAISNCNSTKGLNVRYKFLMTNGPPDDLFHEHFSADEFYIFPTVIAYAIVYAFVVVAVFVCSNELKSRQLLHSTYKLFNYSVITQEIGILFQGYALLNFALNGTGLPRVKNLGRLFESASETIYLLLLLLLAKGYTVTRGKLRTISSVKITVFMCLYVFTYTLLFIYEKQLFDPGEVLYLYESPAGYGLIALRLIAWWIFLYSTIFTLRHYPEKSEFYYTFKVIGSLWFVSGPAFVLISNSLIDKWVRESVFFAVSHVITLAGHILFLVVTLPYNANKNFPYHVRTTQIAAMELCGSAGNSTLSNFGHHLYAPGGPRPSRDGAPAPPADRWVSEVPVELFSISRIIDSAKKNQNRARRPNRRKPVSRPGTQPTSSGSREIAGNGNAPTVESSPQQPEPEIQVPDVFVPASRRQRTAGNEGTGESPPKTEEIPVSPEKATGDQTQEEGTQNEIRDQQVQKF
nr:PREDICTED: transmembrane protein 145-like [Bemisia tabaci]